MHSETKNCQNCKQDFIIESDDFGFYEKMQVPPPTFCPECRMIRRFNYRNEQGLFRRKDGYSGKEIFSGFAPEAPVVTYENSFWYGGDWDPLATGREYDFNRNFFEQFQELLAVAPLPVRSVYNIVNSDYCNEASELKNCYLCFNIDYIENCSYLRKVRGAKESLDCYEVSNNELCYENVLVDNSYQTLFSEDCENCMNVWFSQGLRGCTNCFGCVNLTKKSYYFFNEPYSKEEYEKKIALFNSSSYQEVQAILEKARAFWLTFPKKFYHGQRIVNSTGERIFDSKNVKAGYYIKDAENVRYSQDVWATTSNCYDYSVWGDNAENIYECMTCGLGVYNLKFCFNCWENARDLDYCVYSMGSHDCFGCVGLYKKEYCIFNKQYTKEEYFLLREKIIAHMSAMPYIDAKGRSYAYGEFFPFEISPVAYNESLAQDFFPLDEQSTKEKGYLWRSINLREYQTTLKANNLPDIFEGNDDSIVKEIIECRDCQRAYRIIPMEFDFYKKLKLPLPRLCHNCRFKERFKLVNLPQLYHRSCMCENIGHTHSGKCQTEFETTYSPNRPEIVYCESCYQKEII